MKWIDITRWHPYVLLLYFTGGMLITVLSWNPVLIAVSFFAAAVVGSFFCGRKLWKSLLWLFLPVLLFSAGILPLFSHHGITPLFYVNSQAVTLESICYGIVMSLMLATVFLWFQIAGKLLDGEKLMFLFGRLFPKLGLLVSMIFRMLPLLRSRFREIHEAQRGLLLPEPGIAKFPSGIFARCRQFGRELSVLISWSLESAVETSLSMESRGYGTGRRTSFHLFRVRREDRVLGILLLLLFGLATFMVGKGCFETAYFPAFRMTEMSWMGAAGIAAFLLAGLIPLLGGRRGYER